jgi:hypothetical protein
VRTAEDEGWGQISNGELIKIAEESDYQIMVTCDQNIQYQQNLSGRRISMVVLGSNIWPAMQPKIAEIVAAVQRASPGSFEFIDIAPLPKRRRLGTPPL